jgi:hypothetical protein
VEEDDDDDDDDEVVLVYENKLNRNKLQVVQYGEFSAACASFNA